MAKNIFLNILPGTIKCSLAPCSQKVLEAGGTIFLAKEPCLQCFEPFLVLKGARQIQSIGFFFIEPKKVQKGFLAKKMVPSASRTFWEHGASEHLMVLGKIAKKNVFNQEEMIFFS